MSDDGCRHPGRVIVTGMAGAGRTSCLKLLEDLGYEAIDNVPLTLLPRLLLPDEQREQGLAIGVDSRTRAFEPGRLLGLLREAGQPGEQPALLLFLECDDEVLRRRFTETRRRHPLAADRPVADGIAHERLLLAPLKEAADLVIDTSQLAVTELRRILRGHVAAAGNGLTITVTSFSFRRGLPREADLVLDVRFLANPYYEEALRPLNGRDAAVQAYILADPDFAGFMSGLYGWLLPLLPRYRGEGKSYLTIAVGCTGGQHRSVFIAERLGRRLGEQGWPATTIHRDLPSAPAHGATGSLP